MWRMWFGFWGYTGLTAQSVWLNYMLSAVPAETREKALALDKLRANPAALRCPACDALMVKRRMSTESRPWLSCNRCGVSQIIMGRWPQVQTDLSNVKGA